MAVDYDQLRGIIWQSPEDYEAAVYAASIPGIVREVGKGFKSGALKGAMLGVTLSETIGRSKPLSRVVGLLGGIAVGGCAEAVVRGYKGLVRVYNEVSMPGVLYHTDTGKQFTGRVI